MPSDSGLFANDFKQLVGSCISFYKQNKDGKKHVREKRSKLCAFVEAFHRDCGTLTPSVEQRIQDLKSGGGLVLMTAHQPNFFAYSGVFRKATLNFALSKALEEMLGVPVVNFFGIADQDFTDDRWVRSACLPDVGRRGGVLELRVDLPEKRMLNKVPKPTRRVLDSWRSEVESWIDREFRSIVQCSRSFGLRFSQYKELKKNFEDFWGIVEDTYASAGSFSDFSAFLVSKIVNDVWEYDTLFSRFSECEQIFGREFCFLLSHFRAYSEYVREAIATEFKSGGGVFEHEYDTIPFWYHCDCGGKARLTAIQQGESLLGSGRCVRCGRNYAIDFGTDMISKFSSILSRISARSLSMPLVFFDGLGINCYVGGVAGKGYLDQAKYVAEHLGMRFPPIAIWRPRDVYLGVGQLDALMTFRKLSGTFDLLQYPDTRTKLVERIASIGQRIEKLESEKERLCQSAVAKEEIVGELKSLSAKQQEIRKETGFSLLSREFGLLNNVAAVMNLHPSVIDYAVNIGLKATSEQWEAFLEKNGNFSSDLKLRTVFEDSVKGLPLGFSNYDDSNRIDSA
jgi:hypothetical protein